MFFKREDGEEIVGGDTSVSNLVTWLLTGICNESLEAGSACDSTVAMAVLVASLSWINGVALVLKRIKASVGASLNSQFRLAMESPCFGTKEMSCLSFFLVSLCRGVAIFS